MYRVDPLTGRVFVSLSADSTCYNQLRSATDGYESLILTPFPEKSPPGPVLHAHCRFPDWVQGQWEGMQVLGTFLFTKIIQDCRDTLLLVFEERMTLRRTDSSYFLLLTAAKNLITVYG
ncbi:uncharacterized protein TNIN_190271 [Trichonephila inaurata madagascariensis]|uniref:Uncharacterized protein n=1 Tax=Trichonephila inaurata madagascariensis TaxID=2747483 RepID=A0A8X6YEP2_9ARAC|nr:uncharacterized protein TNIN_190271 [Trichonephila inaurata madagascariensis]